MRILFAIFLSVVVNEATYASSGKYTIKQVAEILKSEGLNIADFEKPDIATCTSEGDYGFDVTTLKEVKYKGNTIPKDSKLGYCHERLEDIILISKVIRFDGFPCFQAVYLEDGKLCGCRIGEEYVFKGHKIPKESKVFLNNGNLLGYSYSEERKEGRKYFYFSFDKDGKVKSSSGNYAVPSTHCE